MKTRRILSALLVALMILPMAIIGVNAESTATPAGTVLYSEDYGTTTYSYDAASLGLREFNGSYAASKDRYHYGVYKVAEGDFGLHLTSTAGNSSVEFLSAEKVKAAHAQEPITNYVMKVDLTVLEYNASSPWIGFHFAYDFDTAESDAYVAGTQQGALWALRGWNSFGIQTLGTYAGGSSWTNTQTAHTDVGVKAKVPTTVLIEVDVVNGTATTYAYMTAGGVLDYYKMMDMTNDTFKTLGGFAFHGCYTSVVYDNISITRGTIANPGTEIYSNDFNDLANGRDVRDANKVNNGTVASLPTATANVVTLDGNNALRVMPSIVASANWIEATGTEIVPASAFDGFTGTKYTVELDLRLDQIASTSVWLTLGGVGTPRVRIGQYASENNAYFLGDNSNFTQWAGLSKTNQGKYVPLVIEVDTETGTGKVFIKGTGYSHNISVPNTLGAINLIAGAKQLAYVDNVRVTAGTFAEAPVSATYYGAQAGVNTNAIRFVGTISKAYNVNTVSEITAVGFHITATYEGGEKTFDTPCTELCATLVGSTGNGITETYTASSMGGSHIFALTIKDIPAEAGEITFVVTPYVTTAAGEVAGTTFTVVYNAATNTIVSQTR